MPNVNRKIRTKSPSGCLSSSCGRFLFNSEVKMKKKTFWLPCLLLWSFLIHFWIKHDTKSSSGCLGSSCGRWFLIKNDTKSSSGCLGSLCGRFLFISRSEKKQHLPLLPWLLLWSFLIQISIRTDTKSIPLWLRASSRGRFLFNS